ncbi:MAG: signal peptide peptidase SppA [Blastocatellia bacterium]|nr:signal peptide peptidase SppA [Blastocatellia bacterium]
MRLRRKSNTRVAIVKIEGVIADSDAFGASRAKILASLKEAQRRNARAIVLRVNSPGGSVAACQEVFAAVEQVKEKGIPVIASMGDVAASGGVYVSMAANEIFANPGTVTGSIGVIIRASDLSHLYDKVGISPKVVKSGPYKDMLATYRSFSKDEESLLQDVIDDTHNQFVEVVATSRKKPQSDIARLADGRIMTGRQAKEAGLVDSLGGLDAAVKRAASLAGLSGEPQIFFIQPRKGLLQRLFRPMTGYGEKAVTSSLLSGVPLWLLPTF